MKMLVTIAGIALILAACSKEKIIPNTISDGTSSSAFIEKTSPQTPLVIRKAKAYLGDIYMHKHSPSVEGVEMRNGFIFITVAHPDYARMDFEIVGDKYLQPGEKVNLRQLEVFYTTNRVLQSDKIVKSLVEFDPAVFKDLSSKPRMSAVDLKFSYSKYIFRYFYGF